MKLEELLECNSRGVVDEVIEAVGKARLTHYTSLGPEETRALYEQLYAVILESVNTGSVTKMVAYAEQLARKRYESGYDLFEVQTAFNVMEECIWRRIMTDLPPSDCVHTIGLVSTVLGAGKDVLAREYVTLACEGGHPAPSPSALFKGTDGA